MDGCWPDGSANWHLMRLYLPATPLCHFTLRQSHSPSLCHFLLPYHLLILFQLIGKQDLKKNLINEHPFVKKKGTKFEVDSANHLMITIQLLDWSVTCVGKSAKILIIVETGVCKCLISKKPPPQKNLSAFKVDNRNWNIYCWQSEIRIVGQS